MRLTPCAICGAMHDLLEMEPSFRRPDAYLRVPTAARAVRTFGSKDACGVRTADGRGCRYYLRVLVPFKVFELEAPVSWGVWADVSEEHFRRANELWDAPDQSREPPFPGKLANQLAGYDGTLDITGSVSLTDPANIPTMRLVSPPDHPFVVEQRTGVPAARLAAWLAPLLHPERGRRA